MHHIPPLGWFLIAAGEMAFIGLSYACFRASREDGDRTPQGKLARATMFFFGMVFAGIALMPLADIAQRLAGFR